MVKAVSKVFKKASAENFKSLLKAQKKDESDPKFALSDALQEYQSQLEKSAGYTNQAKLNDAGIRQDIIQFVIDYPIVELDALKGMDFDDAKTSQLTTEKTIKEYENLRKKDIITEEELAYIQETVGKTNAELKKVLGLSTKLSLGFRDFKKELKPLKLARRVGLTNVPIIGKRIERAIESEERAEQKGLSAKRQLRRKTAKGELKAGTSTSAAADTSAGREDIAKRTVAKSMATDSFQSEGAGGDSEDRVEQERESDAQFDTTSGLLEKIYDEALTTNELLGKKSDEDKGFFSTLSDNLLPLAALTTLGGTIKGAITGLGSTLAGSVKSMLGFGKGKPPVVTGTGKPGQKAAKAAARTGAATTAATTTAAAKNKTKNLVKENVKKGTKVAGKAVKGAARVAGRVFLPLAAIMSVFDAAKGVADAGELLDKEDDELTLRDKASSGFAGFLSGLTFGLVDKKKMANKLAGTSDDPTITEQHDDLGLVKNDQKKLETVEELKADNIEKLTIGKENSMGTTVINNNAVDNSNNTSNTNVGSATIGVNNPNNLPKEMSNIG
tara:strand:+ start:61 stop:1731 length:1671 start_codon:yes stop_codon:yes gene_type:complete